MSRYAFRPLEGLLNQNDIDLQSTGVFDSLRRAEEEISPSPKGRAQKLVLFFLVIRELAKRGIPFYVKGGTILQYHLGEHARANHDLDIIVPGDSDPFFLEAKKALEGLEGDISFTLDEYRKKPAYETFFYNTFSARISVYHEGELIERFIFEGIYGDVYGNIEPVSYEGPSFIEKGFRFLGVPVEYIFAEKILAVTSELARPYKHLVDAYSLAKIDTDVSLLKKYLNIILKEESKARKKYGYPVDEYHYEIKHDKEFTGSYVLAILQSGYQEDEEDVVAFLNAWMKDKGL